MQDFSDDLRTMLAALRAAVATPGDADSPGRLRRRLEELLGPDESVRLRRLVHQVVAASEENLPHDLRRITPLTAYSLQRLSQDLATARGWSPETARRTTQLWASALGFADLAASSWPREEAARTSVPGGGVPLVQTLLPDAPLTAAPTAGPPRVLAADAGAPAPQPPGASRVPVSAPPWPPVPKNLVRHTTNLAGEPALGVVLAYAGMSLPLCAVLTTAMTVVLCLPILVVGAAGAVLAPVGVAGAKLLISRLRRGALVASASGLEFVPYDTSLRNPRPEQSFGAVWPQVQVQQGRVSTLRVAGRRVQVGPRNRAFAAAAAAYGRSLS